MIFDLLAQRIGGAASHVRTKIMLLKEKNCIHNENDKFIE
ncbi:hypothetical protein HMPREF0813_00584 [Streptococcus anginosus F0211]|uniref:Uncharacterized protein n=1 Tax=Streptococcus anginosus F0211 TaxID=706437 RepID=E6J014_STRAP|nr:hypothetical protein HMPREF0813_00584 [Streptococcus anginosus F0211]